MLKYRLLLGTLMAIVFVSLMLLDDYVHSKYLADIMPRATVLTLLVCVLVVWAQLEFAALAKHTGHDVFTYITIPCSILLATLPYTHQLVRDILPQQPLILMTIAILALFVAQAKTHSTKGAIGNCGASLLAIGYLGFLPMWILSITYQFGTIALLMFVFTVKSADIGAYASGRMFGKHKFSPNISPGKTWEGLAGAVIFAAIVGYVFALCSGIIRPVFGMIFGAVFAYIGQLGDLAESMLKRDAQMKDSSASVPGFGGLLDVIDSPLVAAPLAWFYFFLTGMRQWN